MSRLGVGSPHPDLIDLTDRNCHQRSKDHPSCASDTSEALRERTLHSTNRCGKCHSACLHKALKIRPFRKSRRTRIVEDIEAMPEESAKVQVLTAGGAGKQQKKRNRRGGRNKKKGAEIDVAATPEPSDAGKSGSGSGSDTTLENKQHGADRSLVVRQLEFEEPSTEDDVQDVALSDDGDDPLAHPINRLAPYSDDPKRDLVGPGSVAPMQSDVGASKPESSELFWLFVCFLGIMASFVCYGLLLEYTTSGGRKLHELSFLFVTSGLYTLTAAAGRYVRGETPTTIPPGRFAILGLTSMGSTFCSVRSLRYVIFPIQVLAKSCKPVPVMLMGALMGKRYPTRKYINVVMIVLGVALFMGGGESKSKAVSNTSEESSVSSTGQLVGILLLFVSLCFDGGTGAYEDKLMSVYNVEPFDLMFNIQMGKTILAGIGLIVFNQLHIFFQMCQDMGFLLVALGFTGALGQVFIFVTIAKFGALTCSIIGLARKVTTLVASIYFYGHSLNSVQFTGLSVAVGAMVMNFWGKKKGGGGHGGHGATAPVAPSEELEKMLNEDEEDDEFEGDVELADKTKF